MWMMSLTLDSHFSYFRFSPTVASWLQPPEANEMRSITKSRNALIDRAMIVIAFPPPHRQHVLKNLSQLTNEEIININLADD
jgi:hypothetical protein